MSLMYPYFHLWFDTTKVYIILTLISFDAFNLTHSSLLTSAKRQDHSGFHRKTPIFLQLSGCGARGIMFLGCPSVRSSVQNPKYPLSTCTWVHATNHDSFLACPSVHLERSLVIFRRTHGGNDLKFCMLMYPDHLQNWLDYGHGLLIILLLAPLDRSYLGYSGFVWIMLRSTCWGVSGGIFLMLCVELCLVSFICSLQFPLLQSKIRWIIGWFWLNHVYT